ncbi:MULTISPECIES: hypothetical protein [unclassified Shinella]|jgi:hypothetical protein|uniref:hypothetical protein n=1 Tax=unclassified Shinella TaxID=2643062 RepID=UPI0012DD9FF6|nr:MULTISPECIES: hypothetical protein [unclassified Shinella]MCA0341810.1 hypothetical protein [Pseudomonadota bacterium]MCO5148832.1 hypothetical protein [Shinella sp.]MDC7264892.1 hypothetical protein [Shinella sp. HY16]MDC7271789.1 hypothetical protein [Shinella sp. YZ44]MDG4674013.1 hypothetical protein [Shinella sp. 838]
MASSMAGMKARSGHSIYRWSRLGFIGRKTELDAARFNGVIESCTGLAERLTNG